MWSDDDELVYPAGLKLEPAQKEKSFNSNLLSEAIHNALEPIIDKDQISLCQSETMVKQESIAKQGYADKPLYHTLQEKLKRHMVSQNEELPFKCYLCERGFRNKTTLMNHENTHLGLRPHQCQSCKSNFNTSGELYRHTLYIHSREKPKHCTECDYMCVENEKLKRHMRIHTGERPYQCNDCSYAAADPFRLKRHRRTHTGEKPYECDICKVRFTQQNSLKEHQDIHSGNKLRIKCTSCPTFISRKRDLAVHNKRFHYSEQPLLCKKCEMTFPDRYNLRKHQKNHDFKYLQCSICSYSCSNKRRLWEHSLIHNNVKPFECDLCNNQFRTKQLIKRHQYVHHNPAYKNPNRENKCSQCERSFDRKMRLENHMANHITKTIKQQITNEDVVTQETQNEPKMEKYLDQHQWHDKQEKSIDTDVFEIGEIDTLNQTLVTEDLESGEIVDIDKETLVLLLQTKQEVERN